MIKLVNMWPDGGMKAFSLTFDWQLTQTFCFKIKRKVSNGTTRRNFTRIAFILAWGYIVTLEQVLAKNNARARERNKMCLNSLCTPHTSILSCGQTLSPFQETLTTTRLLRNTFISDTPGSKKRHDPSFWRSHLSFSAEVRRCPRDLSLQL